MADDDGSLCGCAVEYVVELSAAGWLGAFVVEVQVKNIHARVTSV
jgi:hypothetical protein